MGHISAALEVAFEYVFAIQFLWVNWIERYWRCFSSNVSLLRTASLYGCSVTIIFWKLKLKIKKLLIKNRIPKQKIYCLIWINEYFALFLNWAMYTANTSFFLHFFADDYSQCFIISQFSYQFFDSCWKWWPSREGQNGSSMYCYYLWIR